MGGKIVSAFTINRRSEMVKKTKPECYVKFLPLAALGNRLSKDGCPPSVQSDSMNLARMGLWESTEDAIRYWAKVKDICS